MDDHSFSGSTAPLAVTLRSEGQPAMTRTSSAGLVGPAIDEPVSGSAEDERPARTGVALDLLPIMAAVSCAFLTIGLALPVLPLHVHRSLGFGTFVVGLVAGSQFAASLVSRIGAGSYSDRRGAKRGVVAGLLAAAVSGFLYLGSLGFPSHPTASVATLLLGRAVLGGAESFIITGGVSWGLGLVEGKHAGTVIAWIGMAMFAAMALGAPLGSVLYDAGGFGAISLATMLLPLCVLLLIRRLRCVPPVPVKGTANVLRVAGAVWIPGIGAAFSSIGYGAILAFSTLLYMQRGWEPVWLAFSAYALSLIMARILFGHLPDRFGGARVALVFVVVEAAGLALIWLAPGVIMATTGAVLTGFGYSLVYPGFGAEAVRSVPIASRGLAMGLYTAFLDIALGLCTPALGLIAGEIDLGTVYLVSAALVLCAAPSGLHLLRRHRA
jgi:MFS family permease